MPTISTEPYFIGASVLTIEADDYTSAVNAAALVPTVPTAEFRDIGGGIKKVVGKPSWVLDLGHAQDWGPDSSLVHYLRINAGQAKTIELVPVGGGRGVTVEAICQETTVGGTSGSIATGTVQLQVNGQPVWDAETP